MTGQQHTLVLRAARFAWKFASDNDFRSVTLLRWKRPENLFQPFTKTSDDRYPEIFQFARDTIGDTPDHRILSFGCSTGEEVFALRHYFPNATIKGIDINKRSIAAAERQSRQRHLRRIEFECASSAAGEAEASYHAIFAMAVFRHGGLDLSGKDASCAHLIRFCDFDATVSGLARALRPGGLLFIAASNFRFCDTATAASFETVFASERRAGRHLTPTFDRENRFLPGETNCDVGFRKKALTNSA